MNATDGVWQYLATKLALTNLLGQDDQGNPYLFQDDLIMTEKYLEGSQQCAVVISQEGEWSSPNTHNHAQFPRMGLEVWADPDRHADGSPVSTNSARDKLFALTDVLMEALHRIGGFDERWGDTRVFASQRLILLRYRTRGMEFQGVTDGNGLARSQLFFGLSTA